MAAFVREKEARIVVDNSKNGTKGRKGWSQRQSYVCFGGASNKNKQRRQFKNLFGFLIQPFLI